MAFLQQGVLWDGRWNFPAGTHAELRGQINRSRRVNIMAGNLVGNTRSDKMGMSARVWKNGTCGFSAMAEYSAEAGHRVLQAAADNAAFMDSHTGKNVPLFPAVVPVDISCGDIIEETEQKTYIEFARALDAYVTEHCPGIISRTLVAMEDSQEKVLVTSDGVRTHTTIPRSYCYVILTAEGRDGNPVERFQAFGGKGTFGKNFTAPEAYYEAIDALYDSLMLKREGVYPEAGVKTVLLGGMMTGMLSHEAVGHTVEADLVLGGSVAGHMLNKQVASELVTMTDFAGSAFGESTPLPVYVDDEGTPAKDALLIDHGILVGYMNNRETAARFGMEPAGNARAWQFSDEPLIRMRNTAVHPGTSKLEDMIASVEDGYYLISSNNGQADTTGEFMFGVTQGYEIRHGKLGRALLDTTISGVAFDMLKTVDMVGDTLTWSSSGFCGKKQPMPVGMGGPALRCRVMMGGR